MLKGVGCGRMKGVGGCDGCGRVACGLSDPIFLPPTIPH